MRQFSLLEIKDILTKTQNAEFKFKESDKRRALESPHLEKMRDRLLRDGDELRGTQICEIPFSSFKRHDIDGDRKEFENLYFERRKRLLTFALLSWLYEREEDIIELENIIWVILNEYTWAIPAHLSRTHVENGVMTKERVGLKELQEDGYMIDLFAAETASALAETISLVGDKLTPILVRRIELYVKRRIFDVIENPYYHWKYSTNNWSAVCAGSCGITAIYLEHDPDKLAKILSISLSAINNFVKGYTEDGGCLEGMSYWLYGFGYFTYFADLLEKRTNGEINLFADEKVEKMAEFPQKAFVYGGKIANFSDTGSAFAFPPSVPSLLANKYKDVKIPPLECLQLDDYSDNCARFALGVRDFVWTDEHLSERAMKSFDVNVLPYAQWYVATSKNGVGIAAKAGYNAEPHNHNDTGSFHVFKNGHMTLADVGSGEYQSQYFGPERYTFFPTSSASHNLPIINGRYQEYGKDKAARDVRISDDGITMDIAAVYGDPTLLSLRRSIHFDTADGNTTLTDEYEFTEAPLEVKERFVTFDEPIVENGKILIGAEDRSTVTYSEKDLDVKVSRVEYSGPVGKRMFAYTIDFTVKNLSPKISLKFEIS